MEADKMLELKEVFKVFNPDTVNEKVALRDVSLTLRNGDFVTVIGGNGAGKSTMLNANAGVFPIDYGSIIIDGIDITKMPEHRRAKFIGRVFQDPMMGTASTMGINENMALHKKLAEGKSLTRDEEETLLDEKIQNHSKVNFRDFQLLIEMGEELF